MNENTLNPMAVNETRIRVRYAEMDAMGVVHHSHYIVWFEIGRSAFMRAVGFPYSEVEAAGYYFRIAELGARYLAPAFYDEVVVIRTWLSQLRSRDLTFSYAVLRPANEAAGHGEETLVTGFTRLVCTDAAGQVRRLPTSFVQLLQPLVQGQGRGRGHASGCP